MTFIDITCMSDRSEEVIIEIFPRRNDTPFFTTRSCRLNLSKLGAEMRIISLQFSSCVGKLKLTLCANSFRIIHKHNWHCGRHSGSPGPKYGVQLVKERARSSDPSVWRAGVGILIPPLLHEP